MNENSAPEKGESWSKDELWVKSAVQDHFDQKIDGIDFNVASKLSAARHRAFDQPKTSRPGWPALAGGGAALALALVVGTRFYVPKTESVPGNIIADSTLNASDLIEDLPLLSASDDIEFYQSLEFLEWMESNS